jgi:hypothetical protein
MIKIDHLKPASSNFETKKTKKTDSPLFSSFINEQICSSTPSAEELTTLTDISSFLPFGELGQADEHTEGKKHGEKLLQYLQNLHLNILEGNVPLANLEQLAYALQNNRSLFVSPALTNILEQIELRAAVELAKYNHN